MKTALLIPAVNIRTGARTWGWETPNERILSADFPTREEALAHHPSPTLFVCRDDGYNRI